MLLKGLCLSRRWNLESGNPPGPQQQSSSAVVPFDPCSPEHKGGLPAVQGQALLRDLRALGMFFSSRDSLDT